MQEYLDCALPACEPIALNATTGSLAIVDVVAGTVMLASGETAAVSGLAAAPYLEVQLWGAAGASTLLTGRGGAGAFVAGLLDLRALRALGGSAALLRIIVGSASATPSEATGAGGGVAGVR